MVAIDFSVQKTRSLVKIVTAAILFVVGLVALLIGGAPRIHVTKDGPGISGPDIAHADAPYSEGGYYGQADYGCGCGDGCGDGCGGDGCGGSSG